MAIGKKIFPKVAAAAAGATDYFNPYVFSGNDSTQTISDIGFAPDLVWFKRRDSDTVGGTNHFLFDTLRGATYRMFSNSTVGNAVDNDSLTAFTSTGFTLGDDVSCNGGDMVAWCFKAGGAQSTLNTSGDLDAYVSANPSKGFSIVQHSKQTANSQTIPHGLSSAPKLIIHKNLAASAWGVFAPSLLGNQYLYLASSSQGASSSAYGWTADANLITTKELTYGYYFGSIFSGTINNMLYCFADVTGVQKIGKYTGNGSTTGTIVTTGFRPRFVIIKGIDIDSDWIILDSGRDSTNPNSARLDANSTGNEYTGEDLMDFNDDGFQLKTSSASKNGLNKNFLYIAIA